MISRPRTRGTSPGRWRIHIKPLPGFANYLSEFRWKASQSIIRAMTAKKYRLQPVLGTREQAKREAERQLAARMRQLAEAEEELARRLREVEACRGRQAA